MNDPGLQNDVKHDRVPWESRKTAAALSVKFPKIIIV